MENRKDAIGPLRPLTFPKRIYIFVSIVLTISNLAIFWFHYGVPLRIALLSSLLEIIVLGVFMAVWLPRYKRAGSRVVW